MGVKFWGDFALKRSQTHLEGSHSFQPHLPWRGIPPNPLGLFQILFHFAIKLGGGAKVAWTIRPFPVKKVRVGVVFFFDGMAFVILSESK